MKAVVCVITGLFFFWLRGVRFTPCFKQRAHFLSKKKKKPTSFSLNLTVSRSFHNLPTAALWAQESHSGVNTLYDNSMNKMNKVAAVMARVGWLLHSTSCGVFFYYCEEKKMEQKTGKPAAEKYLKLPYFQPALN